MYNRSMTSQSLTSQKCEPCEGNVKPYSSEQIAIYKSQVPLWDVIENKKLIREFKLKNFLEALDFVKRIGEIAELEGHHPDINLHNWNKVTVTLWTHKIKGLYLNDFILAAKIDDIDDLEI